MDFNASQNHYLRFYVRFFFLQNFKIKYQIFEMSKKQLTVCIRQLLCKLPTYLLRVPEDACGHATKYATYGGRWQQHAPVSQQSLSKQCHPISLLSFSSVFLTSFFLRFQVGVVLIFKLVFLRNTWHIHFQRLPWTILDSGIVAVLSYNSWFDILSALSFFKIFRRYFRDIKISSFLSFFFGGFSEFRTI